MYFLVLIFLPLAFRFELFLFLSHFLEIHSTHLTLLVISISSLTILYVFSWKGHPAALITCSLDFLQMSPFVSYPVPSLQGTCGWQYFCLLFKFWLMRLSINPSLLCIFSNWTLIFQKLSNLKKKTRCGFLCICMAFGLFISLDVWV